MPNKFRCVRRQTVATPRPAVWFRAGRQAAGSQQNDPFIPLVDSLQRLFKLNRSAGSVANDAISTHGAGGRRTQEPVGNCYKEGRRKSRRPAPRSSRQITLN